MKIWAKTKEFSEGKFLVVRRDGSIPHWPHFVLGARDPAAIAALKAYALAAERLGYDMDYCLSIEELAADFGRYRAEHGKGDPAAGPHRIDDQHVLDAMRGYETTITVKRDKENMKKEPSQTNQQVVRDPAGNIVSAEEMEANKRAYYYDPDGDSDGE